MTWRYDKIFTWPNHDGVKCLGFASVILAVAAIPLLFISVNRIYALQKAEVCLIRETTFYNTVDTVGAVLPFASVAFGAFSLVRCRRNKLRFTSAIPALIGLIIAVAAFSAYYLVLLALAESNLY